MGRRRTYARIPDVTAWISYHFEDDDVWLYYEVCDDGWALRQVDLAGPELRPVTAAALDEVLYIRDHRDLAAMVAYEREYGVLAEGSLAGWEDVEGVTAIEAGEFERIWLAARRALERR